MASKRGKGKHKTRGVGFTVEKTSSGYPPQGDGVLTGPSGELYTKVGALLYDVCMEVDSRAVDYHRSTRKEIDAERAKIKRRIMKLHEFVDIVHRQGLSLVGRMLPVKRIKL